METRGQVLGVSWRDRAIWCDVPSQEAGRPGGTHRLSLEWPCTQASGHYAFTALTNSAAVATSPRSGKSRSMSTR